MDPRFRTFKKAPNEDPRAKKQLETQGSTGSLLRLTMRNRGWWMQQSWDAIGTHVYHLGQGYQLPWCSFMVEWNLTGRNSYKDIQNLWQHIYELTDDGSSANPAGGFATVDGVNILHPMAWRLNPLKVVAFHKFTGFMSISIKSLVVVPNISWYVCHCCGLMCPCHVSPTCYPAA